MKASGMENLGKGLGKSPCTELVYEEQKSERRTGGLKWGTSRPLKGPERWEGEKEEGQVSDAGEGGNEGVR